MKQVLFVVAAAALIAPAFAAEDMTKLAQEKNCLSCHSVANKIVGPAYKDVAAKYKGDKTALDKLTKKVLAGGSGVWGTMAMPANTQVTPEEAKKLVTWVLSQK